MKNLIIIGAGGYAREMYWNVQTSSGFDSEWTIKGFLDGDVKLTAEDYAKLPGGLTVLGDIDSYEILSDDIFTCAVGTPAVRKKLVEKMLQRGAKFVNIISEYAFVTPTAKIGNGVIIGLASHIGDSAELGDFAVMNSISSIGHDVKVGKYTCIMPHTDISGGAQVGDEVFISGHCAILPKAKIGNGAHIGPGSVVLKTVRAGAKVFGNPATEI